MASCTAVGARTKVHEGFSPTGKGWYRALVRESKYGALDAAGVALSVTVREMAPRGFTVAEKPSGGGSLIQGGHGHLCVGRLLQWMELLGEGRGTGEGRKIDFGHLGGREAPY